MRKKLFVSILCAMLVTGCSSTPQVNSIVGSGQVKMESGSGVSEEAGTDGDVAETVTTVDSHTLYESFLKNEITVHIGNGRSNGYYIFGRDFGENDFAFTELVQALVEGVENSNGGAKVDKKSVGIKYAYIDCGNDGAEELLLEIRIPTQVEESVEYFVIKDNNGPLETVYTDEGWSRSNIHINSMGYVYSDGSGGASSSSYAKGYIDAEGRWHHIYTATASTFKSGEDLSFKGDLHTVSSVGDNEYVFLDFDFNNTDGDESDDTFGYAEVGDAGNGNPTDGYKGYYSTELLVDDSLYEESSELNKFFTGEGLTTVSIPDIEKMIEDKENQEGLTSEIKDAGEPAWQKISINF